MVVDELLRMVLRRDTKGALEPFATASVDFEAVGSSWKSWGDAAAESFELAWILRGVRERFWLFKALKYMNLSGQPLGEFMRYYKLAAPQMLVVYDDMDLPFGQLRLRQGGGDGGHNGVKSIASCLGDRGFARLRVGIGRPGSKPAAEGAFSGNPGLSDINQRAAEEKREVSGWLLSNFNDSESRELGATLTLAAQASLEVAVNGLRSAQNKFSGVGAGEAESQPKKANA
jgi:PTH1 family peptidyl-tRNA hydrolase